jgi:hypothetical protein
VGSLTEFQKAVIIGCLLGDGAMRCKKHALLEINHAYSQKEYVDWKFSQLHQLVSTPPKTRFGNNDRIAYRFTTRSLPVLTEIYKQFYSNGKKRIPDNLELKPVTLAVWFMDDGNRSYRALYLNTHKFCMNSQRKLIRMLKDQHQITAHPNKDKKYYRLRIAVASVLLFKRLIEPYILPSFKYKFPS